MVKKTVEYGGFGVPLLLVDWPHIEVEGELIPKIEYSKMEKLLFRSIPLKPARISGAEVKFLRHHMDMTQGEFADWLGDVDSTTIAKWEKADLNPTGMKPKTELDLRLNIVMKIHDEARRTMVSTSTIRKIKEVTRNPDHGTVMPHYDSAVCFPLLGSLSEIKKRGLYEGAYQID